MFNPFQSDPQILDWTDKLEFAKGRGSKYPWKPEGVCMEVRLGGGLRIVRIVVALMQLMGDSMLISQISQAGDSCSNPS